MDLDLFIEWLQHCRYAKVPDEEVFKKVIMILTGEAIIIKTEELCVEKYKGVSGKITNVSDHIISYIKEGIESEDVSDIFGETLIKIIKGDFYLSKKFVYYIKKCEEM